MRDGSSARQACQRCADEASDERPVGDTAAEARRLRELVVKMERVRVAARGGELLYVVLRDRSREIDVVTDAEAARVLLRNRDVPFREVFVRFDTCRARRRSPPPSTPNAANLPGQLRRRRRIICTIYSAMTTDMDSATSTKKDYTDKSVIYWSERLGEAVSRARANHLESA